LDQVLDDQEPMPLFPPSSPSNDGESSSAQSDAELPSAASAVGLTRREMDVLHLLAQGLTSVQIAEKLIVSTRTINAHLRSIYSKLGVSSRVAAVRYALDNRLI
jgi:DNA-binding NarL/FixJ family response regulator